eukprot:scaffold33809_cov21-Tisochrysis_lutea.AAC.8
MGCGKTWYSILAEKRSDILLQRLNALGLKADDARRRLDAALKALSGAQQGAAHKQQQMADIRAATERCSPRCCKMKKSSSHKLHA